MTKPTKDPFYGLYDPTNPAACHIVDMLRSWGIDPQSPAMKRLLEETAEDIRKVQEKLRRP